MSDYDFKSLNDKEFESFCTDVLSRVLGVRIERFKPGRDEGVDGRYFAADGREVVLQYKHWAGTSTAQLIRRLESDEKPKLDRLRPKRYILAVSNSLSRANKTKMREALAPYVRRDDDIFGREDLNQLIDQNVESRHYKLWIKSSAVISLLLNQAIIGRSTFAIDEILRAAERYVVTAKHEAALNKLDELGAIIISGEPGIGKTTLANQICLNYVAKGYRFYLIVDDVKEAESVYEDDALQIFYFDDFLGRNYLDALRGHESSAIAQFLRRVSRNKNNKRLVLTSRSTVLNQGKFIYDYFETENLQRNEFELSIGSLSDMDRAQILYNHIWHSELPPEFVAELYAGKRYRAVIAHRNFNPRLINYVTDVARLGELSASSYWPYVLRSLVNPSQIWENPFEVQQDDFGRVLVFLVVLNGRPIEESKLNAAYAYYLQSPHAVGMRGRRDFASNVRLLSGSFLNRLVDTDGSITLDLFNPSIGDYVLKRYVRDVQSLRIGVTSLRSLSALNTIRSLRRDKLITLPDTYSVVKHALDVLGAEAFDGAEATYVARLGLLWFEVADTAQLMSGVHARRFVQYVVDNSELFGNHEELELVAKAVEFEIVDNAGGLAFLDGNAGEVISQDAIRAASLLLATIDPQTEGLERTRERLGEQVYEIMAEDLSDYIDVTDAYHYAGYGEYENAKSKMRELVEEKLDELGVKLERGAIDDLVDHQDVVSGLDRYYEDREEDQSSVQVASGIAVDDIDDLFERD